MRISSSKDEFKSLFDRAFPLPAPRLPLVVPIPPKELPPGDKSA